MLHLCHIFVCICLCGGREREERVGIYKYDDLTIFVVLLGYSQIATFYGTKDIYFSLFFKFLFLSFKNRYLTSCIYTLHVHTKEINKNYYLKYL